VDVESLKRALRELVEREPTFFRDLFLDAFRVDGRIAEALLDLFTKHPEAKLRLAQAVAETVAIPLNVATKEDLKQLATKQDLETAVEQLKKWAEEKFATKQVLEQLKKWAEERFVTKEHFDAVIKELRETMATKEDLKRIENRMATKEQIESMTISVEDSGREMVQFLLEQRGFRCAAERLRLDFDYEFNIYCNAGAVAAVGEAKVRAGGRDVEKTVERIRELERRWPDEISDRLVPVFTPSSQNPSPSRR
jgi:hypothetical protein